MRSSSSASTPSPLTATRTRLRPLASCARSETCSHRVADRWAADAIGVEDAADETGVFIVFRNLGKYREQSALGVGLPAGDAAPTPIAPRRSSNAAVARSVGVDAAPAAPRARREPLRRSAPSSTGCVADVPEAHVHAVVARVDAGLDPGRRRVEHRARGARQPPIPRRRTPSPCGCPAAAARSAAPGAAGCVLGPTQTHLRRHPGQERYY